MIISNFEFKGKNKVLISVRVLPIYYPGNVRMCICAALGRCCSFRDVIHSGYFSIILQLVCFSSYDIVLDFMKLIQFDLLT